MSQVGLSKPRPLVAPSRLTALLWKQLREFSVLMVILSCLLLAWTVFVPAIAMNKQTFLVLVFALPITLSAGLAIALPIMAFINERESGTDKLLAQFPISGFEVGFSKYVACVVALVAFLALETVCVYLSFAAYQSSFILTDHLYLIVMPLATLAVGVLASILCSTSIGALTVTTSLAFGLNLIALPVSRGFRFRIQNWSFLEPFDLVVVLFTVIANFLVLALIGNWLRPRRAARKIGSSAISVFGKSAWTTDLEAVKGDYRNDFLINAEVADANVLSAMKHSNRGRLLSVLLWQAFIQQRKYLAIAFVAIFAFAILGAISTWTDWITAYGFWISLVGMLLGLGSIEADRRRSRFRFFQQHGERSFWFWVSRVTFPLLLLLISSLIVGAFMSSLGEASVIRVISYWLIGTSAFAVTLLLCLMIRSYIFNMTISMTMCVLMCLIGETVMQMDMQSLAIAMLIPFAMLLFSLWQTKFWLSSSTSLWRYALVGMLSTLVLTGIILLVRQHRLNQADQIVSIWKSGQASERQQWGSPPPVDYLHLESEPIKLNRLLNEFAAFEKTTKPISEFSAQNELVDRLIENRDPISVKFGAAMSFSHTKKGTYVFELRAMLRRMAEEKECIGFRKFELLRLVQAIDRQQTIEPINGELLDWIGDPKRTREELEKAVVDLLNQSPGRLMRTIEKETVGSVREGELEALGLMMGLKSPLLYSIPWERKRFAKILRHEALQTDTSIRELEALSDPTSTFDRHRVLDAQLEKTQRYFPDLIGSPGSFWPYRIPNYVNQDRYAAIRAALELHRMKTGAYPDHLEQLVPGELEVLPCCVTGGVFAYMNPNSGDNESTDVIAVHQEVQKLFGTILFPGPLDSVTTDARFFLNDFYKLKRKTLQNLSSNEYRFITHVAEIPQHSLVEFQEKLKPSRKIRLYVPRSPGFDMHVCPLEQLYLEN